MGALAPDATYGRAFGRLRAAAGADWDAYTRHAFVRGLADGTLPESAFRAYLVQDYLFLVQFARAYALAAFKADGPAEMRAAARTLTAILDVEMDLHVRSCARWGLGEADMAATPEAMETTAYTRFVLDSGQRGDALDLAVALAPCVLGYGEIGRRLAGDPATRRDGNAYGEWIDAYAGEDYQAVARDAGAELDRLWRGRGGDARAASLADLFGQATRLEAAFWDMGLRAAGEDRS